MVQWYLSGFIIRRLLVRILLGLGFRWFLISKFWIVRNIPSLYFVILFPNVCFQMFVSNISVLIVPFLIYHEDNILCGQINVFVCMLTFTYINICIKKLSPQGWSGDSTLPTWYLILISKLEACLTLIIHGKCEHLHKYRPMFTIKIYYIIHILL